MQQNQGVTLVKLDFKNSSKSLLYLLLATDVGFILLHILHAQLGLTSNRSFSLEIDRGYAELFQYIKEYWIAVLLGVLAVQKRSILYSAWSLLFGYLLIDDFMSIHERLGEFISTRLAFLPALNLRAVDFGELVVSACIGLFFLIFLTTAYRFGDRMSRQASRYLIKMLFALAFCGIVVDMIHIAVKIELLEPLFVILEDGGEMLVMSFIAGFVFLLPERSSQNVIPSSGLNSNSYVEMGSEEVGARSRF